MISPKLSIHLCWLVPIQHPPIGVSMEQSPRSPFLVDTERHGSQIISMNFKYGNCVRILRKRSSHAANVAKVKEYASIWLARCNQVHGPFLGKIQHTADPRNGEKNIWLLSTYLISWELSSIWSNNFYKTVCLRFKYPLI